jgi:predicted PurR-regulated permease PerM
MPNPMLWGVLAAASNYLPYLGAVACGAIVALVALLTFDTIGRALAVPATFFALNFAEAYLVTPRLLGNRLALNPVAIFLGVAFWGWLWGVAGALLAVPILATVKIVCDGIESLKPVGEFLGE